MNVSPETAAAFREWFPEHKKIFNNINWPDPEDDRIGVFRMFAATLIKHGAVDADHLFEITRRMVKSGVKTFDLTDHLKLLTSMAIAYFREVYRPEHAAPPDSIEAARHESRECDVCGGMGIFLAHRQKSYDPDRRDNTINVYCRCPYGRKIRENHKANNPDAFKRFYDLDQYPFLADDEFRTPRSDLHTEAFHRRCARIVDWLHAQAPDVQDRWRDVAFAGLSPGVLRNHPHADDFVAGVIANRHPEFEG